MRSFPAPHLTAAASALLLSVPVQAQQQDLTAGEVESYFQQIQRDAVDMIEAQEPERIVAWIRDNIADGAAFQVTIDLSMGGQRKGFAVLDLERDDMLRAGGIFAGAFRQGIGDYSLRAQVTEVISHGPGAATARVTWHEAFTIAGPAADRARAPGGGPFAVEAVAECRHLLQRSEARLAIGLSTCEAELRH